MFLTNVLIVMRGWANSPPQQVEGTPIVEDWDLEDVPSNNSTTWDRMRTSAHHLFVKMVDYLRLSVLPGQTDRMPRDLEFDLWKRIISNKWTMNEKVTARAKRSSRSLTKQ